MNSPQNGSLTLPPWLQEVLPAWFIQRPAFTETLYYTSITLGKSMTTLLVAAYTVYAALVPNANPVAFGTLLLTHPWTFGFPLLWAGTRGQNALSNTAKRLAAALAAKES